MFLAAVEKYAVNRSFCNGATIPYARKNLYSLHKEESRYTKPVYWPKGDGQQSTDRISQTKLADYGNSHPTHAAYLYHVSFQFVATSKGVALHFHHCAAADNGAKYL
jgi:hypothetical protein